MFSSICVSRVWSYVAIYSTSYKIYCRVSSEITYDFTSKSQLLSGTLLNCNLINSSVAMATTIVSGFQFFSILTCATSIRKYFELLPKYPSLQEDFA